MELPLNPEEVRLLADVLERRLLNLAHEIHHTDTAAFRAELRRQEEVLHGLHERLLAPAAR